MWYIKCFLWIFHLWISWCCNLFRSFYSVSNVNESLYLLHIRVRALVYILKFLNEKAYLENNGNLYFIFPLNNGDNTTARESYLSILRLCLRITALHKSITTILKSNEINKWPGCVGDDYGDNQCLKSGRRCSPRYATFFFVFVRSKTTILYCLLSWHRNTRKWVFSLVNFMERPNGDTINNNSRLFLLRPLNDFNYIANIYLLFLFNKQFHVLASTQRRNSFTESVKLIPCPKIWSAEPSVYTSDWNAIANIYGRKFDL